MSYIPVYYYLSNNFGDAMSHYITAKISGHQPVLLEVNDPNPKYMLTGSILNNDVANAYVWGCGVAFSNDVIPAKTKIYAVRGRLTGELCRKQEVPFDEVYGDPALLMPRFYSPNKEKKYKLGIIPHYVDLKRVFDVLRISDSDLQKLGIKIINVCDDIESVVDQINQCEKTISSSLHGIITSNAYGVPCQWTKFTDKIGGDDFKYHDYFSTTNVKEVSFLDLRHEFNVEDVKHIANNMDIEKTIITEDLDLLYNSCPFRK